MGTHEEEEAEAPGEPRDVPLAQSEGEGKRGSWGGRSPHLRHSSINRHYKEAVPDIRARRRLSEVSRPMSQTLRDAETPSETSWRQATEGVQSKCQPFIADSSDALLAVW